MIALRKNQVLSVKVLPSLVVPSSSEKKSRENWCGLTRRTYQTLYIKKVGAGGELYGGPRTEKGWGDRVSPPALAPFVGPILKQIFTK